MSAPSPAEFDKLGLFYLGRAYDPSRATSDDGAPMLYDSRHLLTHALCVGMTGSGKTGLCLALLEEAAIDGVPAIVVDPKGDLSNLLLTFPSLEPKDFRPFVDDEEAARRGTTPDALAADIATTWRNGLAEWGQDGARIQRFRDACEVVVYTPGSTAGAPLSLLGALTAPPASTLEDAESLTGLVEGTASGLLALAGVDADVRSREHVLVSQILVTAWQEGRDVDLAALVQAIQKPPFTRLGALDLDGFFPAKDRAGLALAINALLASPAAAAWAKGDPLDPGALLRTAGGKPKIAILSIAHLSDAQRMFFVTRLLDSVVAWMRRQAGTSSLRALLYMDEIFGYFPPTAAPPSKRPMLTLLKQARAFGVGVVLATQNPVDLDYKGLANCGTWFLGRLQAERDKLRVLDGLEGASAAVGQGLDRAAMDRTLSGLASRVFYCHDVHGSSGLFRSRHTLSYLRGPLTRDQLAALATRTASTGGAASTASEPATPMEAAAPATPAATTRPAVPGDVDEVFFPPRAPGGAVTYRPGVLAIVKLHYVHAKAEVDAWQTLALVAPFQGEGADEIAWEHATPLALPFAATGRKDPEPGASFATPPTVAAKRMEAWKKKLVAHAYQARPLVLLQSKLAGAISRPGESPQDFQSRLAQATREARDEAVASVQKKYGPKFEAMNDKLQKLQQKLAKEQADVKQQQMGAAVTFGSNALGAVFGRGLLTGANARRAGSVVRGAQRVAKEQGDVGRVQAEIGTLHEKWTALQAEANAELQRVQSEVHAGAGSLEELRVAPRKADTSVDRFAFAWVPFRMDSRGTWLPAW